MLFCYLAIYTERISCVLLTTHVWDYFECFRERVLFLVNDISWQPTGMFGYVTHFWLNCYRAVDARLIRQLHFDFDRNHLPSNVYAFALQRAVSSINCSSAPECWSLFPLPGDSLGGCLSGSVPGLTAEIFRNLFGLAQTLLLLLFRSRSWQLVDNAKQFHWTKKKYGE